MIKWSGNEEEEDEVMGIVRDGRKEREENVQ